MQNNKSWPLVSVCVISFNRLAYLKRTLESFRACCTYPNLEYIIVDNGSEKEVADHIGGLDYFYMKIMNEKNMGHGYAMNQARRIARGGFFFNLENDWLFFYRGDWLERGVMLFEKDARGEPIRKFPPDLPLGLVKYRLGAEIRNYTNNPSLVSREAYETVGEYTQLGREYKYVSESFGKLEKEYIARFGSRYSCALSETPCAIHIGGFTTNPNYGNRGRKTREELDRLLAGDWKNGKWWFTWHYNTLVRRLQMSSALRKYRRFEATRRGE